MLKRLENLNGLKISAKSLNVGWGIDGNCDATNKRENGIYV